MSTSILAAADWATYVIPTLIVLSLISKLFSKKDKDDANDQPAGGTPAPAPGGSKAASWEEEIKRLLEGEAPAAPPAPPPLVDPQPSRSMPPPIPVGVARGEESPEPSALPLPPIFSRRGQEEETESHEAHVTEHAPRLRQAETAAARAAHFHETVAKHFESIDRHPESGSPVSAAVQLHRRSAEVESMLALLRQPRSARQVFIAQAVIGPPKGMEG